MRRILLAAAMGLFATSTFAHPVDPIAALIRRQTDLASNAGQSGDQATVDRLTSDLVLFSAGDGTVQRDAKFDADDAVSAELKARTEAFHGAGRPARRRGLAEAGDLFIDQDGTLNPHTDFTGGPAVVGDWVAHHTADVAVTSFTLQARGAQFRTVEIWGRCGNRWTFMGGQTIPLHRDPPVIALSADALDAYAGTYSAGPGSVVVITRTADGLASTVDGGKPADLKPEARDLFFTPDLPAGYLRPHNVFRRDADGRVAGFQRNGLVFQRIEATTATPGPAPRPGPLKLRDFRVRHVGGLAIAAFYHDRNTPYHGQMLHQTYRSMEAWIDQGGAWRMISSQGFQL